VRIGTQTLSADGTASLNVTSDSVVFRVANAVSVAVPLNGLPFGIVLQSATATKAGIQVIATAQGLVLHPH